MYTFFIRTSYFWLRLNCSYLWTRFWQFWHPPRICLKCVLWFPLFVFLINLHLAWIFFKLPISIYIKSEADCSSVLIKVVLIKKVYYTFIYKNQLFLAEAQLFLFLNSILTSFQPWTSSLHFTDQFAHLAWIFFTKYQFQSIKSEAGCSYKSCFYEKKCILVLKGRSLIHRRFYLESMD